MLGATILALALGAAPAGANTGQTIINRCLHGKSLGGFTQRDYQQALQELPTEVEEYSNCSSLIEAALRAAAPGRSSPSARATVATPLSASEQTSIVRASKVSGPLQVGGQTVEPGIVHANVASALSSLPTPLLAVLIFLLAGALLTAGGALRNFVRRNDRS